MCTNCDPVQHAVHLLSASLNAAVDNEIIESNPASRIKLPGSAQAQERYLTLEEYAAVVEELPTSYDQLLVEMLAYTGLRWGEVAGLHWNRVDLGRGLVASREKHRLEEMADRTSTAWVPDVPSRRSDEQASVAVAPGG